MNPDGLRLTTLDGEAREVAVPVIKDGFVGIYRWHAKRTLRSVSVVRAAWLGEELVGVALLERLVPEVGYVYYVSVGAAHRLAPRGGSGRSGRSRRGDSQAEQDLARDDPHPTSQTPRPEPSFAIAPLLAFHPAEAPGAEEPERRLVRFFDGGVGDLGSVRPEAGQRVVQ